MALATALPATGVEPGKEPHSILLLIVGAGERKSNFQIEVRPPTGLNMDSILL